MDKHKLQKETSPKSGDVFIRHGSFERYSQLPQYETFKEFLSNPDAFPLSEKGKEEIKKVVELIPDKETISLILSSPYRRTEESARIIQEELLRQYQKEVPIKITELLREIDIPPDVVSETEFYELLKKGGAETIADAVFEKWRAGQSGELPEEVEKRAKDFLKYTRRVHKWTLHEKIAVISHTSFGRALRRVIGGRQITLPRKDDAILETGGHYFI